MNRIKTDESPDKVSVPWVAAILLAASLLCCLFLLGLALLDELMGSHPLGRVFLGTASPTPVRTFIATQTPARTPTLPLPTPEEAKDDFEPDDSPPQASPIEPDGTHQAHNLSPPGDRDYVSFAVEAGMSYTVQTGELGAHCDTFLTLYDANGAELAQDDDSGEESLASRMNWTALSDGTLFAEVRQFDQEVVGEETQYEIWVSVSEPMVLQEDEYEPDDTMEQASQILLGVPQEHGIHSTEDTDWIFFDTEAGKTYVVETSGLRGGMDTMVSLYDEQGRKLGENDDGGAEDLSSRIIWMARASDTAYVAVQGYSGYEVGPEMGYTIVVSEGAPYEGDEYETDDTLEEASVLQVGSSQEHNLHVTGDRDWIAFQAVAGTEYVIETFHLGDKIDTFMTLYDAEGLELGTDDDSGAEPLASHLDYEPEGDGIVYVMAHDMGDREAGPGTEYSISVREQGTLLPIGDRFEPDDGMEQAGQIEIGEVQTHNIHVPGDHDWVTLQVEAGHTYVIQTHDLAEEMDTVLALYSGSGQELAQDDDGADEPGASRIVWATAETGTVYLMVRDYKDDRAGQATSYDLSVYDIGAEAGYALPGVHVVDGAYHIMTFERGRFVVGVSQSLLLGDFALEVEAEQVQGDDDNEYGLVCGYQDEDNYYELAISGDGYAGFFVKERGRWESISPFRSSEAVNQGNASNLLRLEVKGSAVTFLVNGEIVVQDFDASLGEGMIGFGCGSFGEPGLHCAFDSLTVWDDEGSVVWQDDFDDNAAHWYESPAP
jgi:hypothetical protein